MSKIKELFMWDMIKNIQGFKGLVRKRMGKAKRLTNQALIISSILIKTYCVF